MKALARYLRFRNSAGAYVTDGSWQDFFPGENRVFNSVTYRFAPMVFSGKLTSGGADSPTLTLVTIPNALTVNILTEAVRGNYRAEVLTVNIQQREDNTFLEGAIFSREVWAVRGGTNEDTDEARVTLRMSSPLDAVSRQLGRPLSKILVGSLPATGQIYTK